MLSGLLVSVTDAVILYTIDDLDPAKTVKSWLKRDSCSIFEEDVPRKDNVQPFFCEQTHDS
jgi:hypothetical protein